MTEQAIEPKSEPKGKASSILRKVIQYLVLGLLLFTCIMAAYRKFGG
jgi:hypothetical protein